MFYGGGGRKARVLVVVVGGGGGVVGVGGCALSAWILKLESMAWTLAQLGIHTHRRGAQFRTEQQPQQQQRQSNVVVLVVGWYASSSLEARHGRWPIAPFDMHACPKRMHQQFHNGHQPRPHSAKPRLLSSYCCCARSVFLRSQA